MKNLKASGHYALGFLKDLREIQRGFQVKDKSGKTVPLGLGLSRAIGMILDASRIGRKLIFIGNGGSAAIASHQAVDFWKNGGVEAIAFNDASLLTCIGNDLGFQNLFSKPIEVFARRGDVLFAISSSGQSADILNGVKAAQSRGCHVITLSGFKPNNPLRSKGDLNFYVPVRAYGLVEVSHLSIIHALLRETIYLHPKANKGSY